MTIRLSFGTAGIRAELGPGEDQLNLHAVRGIAHALASYLKERFEGARTRGLCIGFDGRTDSALFAREVERVALLHGLRVRAFAEPVPTPLLAFCTRHHDAVAGVMITASHNPPGDNGVKIYLERGAQVLAPHDGEIARRLLAFEPDQLPPERPRDDALCSPLGAAEVEAYLDAIVQLVATPSGAPVPRFAYSALCGVGSAVTHKLLSRAGAQDVVEVAEQAEPRADFGGLSSPNPEHASALTRLLARAEEARVDLAFAHDPDADRLAVALRGRDGVLRALSGDEVGALLGSFLLAQCPTPERALLVSTVVSGELLEHVARAHGARFERTLTGFKWIASRARALELDAGLSFVFGYEEALGYAFGQMADDKDGIAALYVLLELARRLGAEGRTLRDELDALALRYGVCSTRQITLARGTGSDSCDLLRLLRSTDPAFVLGPGASRVDYRERPEDADLLVFRGSDGSKLCARPSGTEPKLKLYLHARAGVADGDLSAAQATASARLDEIAATLGALSAATA